MANELLDFIAESPSPFHVVEQVKTMLVNAGFQPLCLKKQWQLKKGGRYFTTRGGTAIVAFTIETDVASDGFRMVAAHSDSPSLRVKPNPLSAIDGKMLRIATETYGGALLYSWLDRPLAVAGRIYTKTDNPLHPKSVLVDSKTPIGVVPSVAIHFNRNANDGLSLNKQIDMQPLIATEGGDSVNSFFKTITDVPVADILGYDLNMYDAERGTIVGLNNEMVVAPKLDDLAMVFTATKALCAAADKPTNKMLCLFDSEEVGSNTKQGACSPLLPNIIERIAEQLSLSAEDRQRITYNSFLISADMAHALHPNHPELHDPTNRPVLNGGPVVKFNCNQKYMTDGSSAAVVEALLDGLDHQTFVNRSDMAGGSTLGNLLTSQIDIAGADIGAPLLAMHSARETAGTCDILTSMLMFERFMGA